LGRLVTADGQACWTLSTQAEMEKTGKASFQEPVDDTDGAQTVDSDVDKHIPPVIAPAPQSDLVCSPLAARRSVNAVANAPPRSCAGSSILTSPSAVLQRVQQLANSTRDIMSVVEEKHALIRQQSNEIKETQLQSEEMTRRINEATIKIEATSDQAFV
jgi:hypothetical protein